MSKHEKFIFTPITNVIEEMITATSCIGSGIENYPLWDYILQSTFTKMTGFQEQKLKCIDWELATNGFEYRREFISNTEKGEYSTYRAKNMVYKALIDEIVRYSGISKKSFMDAMKRESIIKPQENIEKILDGANVIFAKQNDYNDFKKCGTEFENQFYNTIKKDSDGVTLFQSVLVKQYSNLYAQRNRIAHNTLSYQQNLPDLERLKKEDDFSRNYFFWFAVLNLIDEIFMDLFKRYLCEVERNSFFNE